MSFEEFSVNFLLPPTENMTSYALDFDELGKELVTERDNLKLDFMHIPALVIAILPTFDISVEFALEHSEIIRGDLLWIVVILIIGGCGACMHGR